MKISKFILIEDCVNALYIDHKSKYAIAFVHDLIENGFAIRAKNNNIYIIAIELNHLFYVKTIHSHKKPSVDYFKNQILRLCL